MTVLIVDDSLTVRMDLAEAFASAGFVPVPCATVAAARERLAGERFDLVVLDVVLPDGDGVELLKEIRSAHGDALPVLMLSSEKEVSDRVHGMRTGADEYVGKPYHRTYVVSRAHELVRASGAPERRMTVLVIDDSPAYSDALRSALEAESYRVVTAADGEHGLRVAADLRPDAIVVDGVLPGIDGAAVTRRVRLDAALRRTPCVVLTTSGDERSELRAFDAGADACVRKEEGAGVLLARLATVLRGARTRPGRLETSSLLGPKRVMVADGGSAYLRVLSHALEGEGYDVVAVRSGEEAFRLLGVQPVACVLLDLALPELGGPETCRRIRGTPELRDTPLILLATPDESGSMIDGLAAGADDFVVKSRDFDVLRARVHALLRRRQGEEESRRFREELSRVELEASEARAARELAETRAALVEELERKNEELESFSYSVSHDLRAPLRAINGFARILSEDHGDELSDDARECVELVRSNVDRMGQLIDGLLAFSRLGRQTLRKRPLSVADLTRSTLDEFRTEIDERRVDVTVADLPDAEGDPVLLRQVFVNLISNAIKFTRHVERPSIEVGSRDDLDPGGARVYYVRDNGAGFDARYAHKLFGVFQRLHTAEQYEGTGVGLAVVKRVVERHGGRVWAESEIGRGTTFYFTLGGDSRSDE